MEEWGHKDRIIKCLISKLVKTCNIIIEKLLHFGIHVI